MTLSEWFHTEQIDTFAAVDTAKLPPRKPYLLSRVPQAKSAVFAVIPYYRAGETSNLSMYARGRDYHGLATRLGRDAVELLRQRYPDSAVAEFADHSPYPEVYGAAMAGLGVIGDNGLLITEKYSSFVFIFELVSDLPPSAWAAEGVPVSDGGIRYCEHCGACRRACPGGCIGGENARDTCLSAISQKKTDLTEEEIRLLRRGRYIWGCDVCQDVCPHTARALRAGTLETRVPYFLAKRIPYLTEKMLSEMSEEEYAAYAFSWRPKRILRRNLALLAADGDGIGKETAE